jgi:hypothetical protein
MRSTVDPAALPRSLAWARSGAWVGPGHCLRHGASTWTNNGRAGSREAA